MQYLGFCVTLCADRGAFFFDSAPATNYPIGWIGDPSFQCPDTCSPNKKPSGSLTIDATINFLAQLLTVIKTNPFFNGWYDDSNSYNYSNVEKCSWNFGTPLGGMLFFPRIFSVTSPSDFIPDKLGQWLLCFLPRWLIQREVKQRS